MQWMLMKLLSRLIGNYVRPNHINCGMPPKWSATLVEEILDNIGESVCVSNKVTILEQMHIY